MKQFAKRTLPFLVAWGIAIYMAPWVFSLAQYQDKQTLIYDQALQMMASENPMEAGQALQVFVQSNKAFLGEQPKSWSERYFLPQPDQEMAALAMFHVGNMLRLQKQPKEALGAYVESLRLNAGQRMLLGVSARDDGSHQYGRDFCVALADKVGQARPVTSDDCQLLRLEKQADDTRNNLLSLLSEHPELAPLLAEPGKLKGPPVNGQPVPGAPGGEPGDQVMPGKDPGDGDNPAI
jgi:hypothetical protein